MQQAKELKDRQILDNFYVEIFISLFFNKKSTTPPTPHFNLLRHITLTLRAYMIS